MNKSRVLVGASVIAAILVLIALLYKNNGKLSNEAENQNAISRSTGQIAPEEKRKETSSKVDDFSNSLQALMQASDAGDANASWKIASLFSDCMMFVRNPGGFDSDIETRTRIRPDLAGKYKSVHDLTIQRCESLVGQKIGSREMQGMLAKAAQQGSLAARAELFVRQAMRNRDQLNSAEVSEFANQVLLAKDPEALAALAPLMGRISEGFQDQISPLPAGNDLAEAAWNVAACRLGRNCTSASPAVVAMCWNGGVNCELRDIPSFYRQEILSAVDANKLNAEVNLLTNGGSI